ASTARAMARFLGEWNCSQSRSAAKARRAFRSSSRVFIVGARHATLRQLRRLKTLQFLSSDREVLRELGAINSVTRARRLASGASSGAIPKRCSKRSTAQKIEDLLPRSRRLHHHLSVVALWEFPQPLRPGIPIVEPSAEFLRHNGVFTA